MEAANATTGIRSSARAHEDAEETKKPRTKNVRSLMKSESPCTPISKLNLLNSEDRQSTLASVEPGGGKTTESTKQVDNGKRADEASTAAASGGRGGGSNSRRQSEKALAWERSRSR